MATQEQTILYKLQDEMVQRAERLVRDLNLPQNEGVEKGKTQASKALEVAQTAGSLTVFINWLRYQAGRESSTLFWTKVAGKQTLARALTSELNWLQSQVTSAMSQQSKAEQQQVVMRAVTRFLGYFRRALVGADYLSEITLGKEG